MGGRSCSMHAPGQPAEAGPGGQRSCRDPGQPTGQPPDPQGRGGSRCARRRREGARQRRGLDQDHRGQPGDRGQDQGREVEVRRLSRSTARRTSSRSSSSSASQISATTGGTPGPVHNKMRSPDRNWDGNATDDNSTYWVPDFNRTHFKDLMFGGGGVVQELLHQAVQRPLLGQGRRVRLGHGPVQRGALRLQQVRQRQRQRLLAVRQGHCQGLVRRSGRSRHVVGGTSRPTSRSSTRSIATTTTTTASSPSPTATSTTSRRSTPVRARRPAAALRARTRSGPTVGSV